MKRLNPWFPPLERGERGDFTTLDVCTAGKNHSQSPFSKGGGEQPTTRASIHLTK